MKSERRSWRGDTLTVVSSSRSGWASCHRRFWRQACSSTQSPTGPMSPDSSSSRHELVGADQAALGRGPSQQGLDAHQLVVVEGHHRQVEHPELFLVEGLLQAPLDGGRGQGGAQREVEHGDGAVVGSGLAQRGGGLGEHVAGLGVAVLDGRDARRAVDLDQVGADAERHRDGVQQRPGPLLGGPGVVGGRVEDDELRPAEPVQGLAAGERGEQLIGRGDEDAVADLVAVGVVDALEPAELDEVHHAQTVAVAALGVVLQQGGEGFLEAFPVGQAGEDVEAGGALEVVACVGGGALGREGEADRDDRQRQQAQHDDRHARSPSMPASTKSAEA